MFHILSACLGPSMYILQVMSGKHLPAFCSPRKSLGASKAKPESSELVAATERGDLSWEHHQLKRAMVKFANRPQHGQQQHQQQQHSPAASGAACSTTPPSRAAVCTKTGPSVCHVFWPFWTTPLMYDILSRSFGEVCCGNESHVARMKTLGPQIEIQD